MIAKRHRRVLNSLVPNQRTAGQKLVGFWADERFRAKIDQARGVTHMSRFIREAVAEYLAKRGIHVPREEIEPPDRAGKGGPPTKALGMTGPFSQDDQEHIESGAENILKTSSQLELRKKGARRRPKKSGQG